MQLTLSNETLVCLSVVLGLALFLALLSVEDDDDDHPTAVTTR